MTGRLLSYRAIDLIGKIGSAEAVRFLEELARDTELDKRSAALVSAGLERAARLPALKAR